MATKTAPRWVMTVEYAGVLPFGSGDDGDPGDSRVNLLGMSRMGDTATRLSASVAAVTDDEARQIGLVGIGRWAAQIGLDADHPVVVSLFLGDSD